ncbi:TetR/AcrR family transcriptional regulator [Sphingomonas lenta]|uniref:TetR/AcrR family transcriptional regulator n=1 Tax=Sphingomonas lenta TaxID=1141887 RepID=UPI0026B91152
MVWGHPCCVGGVSRAELRRRKLIDTARKLFIANGFHATGIAQIARESGIAVGQIYRDFASKEEIVAALVEVDCGAYMDGETLDAAIRAGDAESVRTWLHHFVEPDEDLEEGRLFAEIVAESSRNERIAAIFTTLQDRLKAKIVSAIALLAPGEGLAERRGALADLITALSLGLLHYRLLRPTVDAGALAQALREVIDRELAALR